MQRVGLAQMVANARVDVVRPSVTLDGLIEPPLCGEDGSHPVQYVRLRHLVAESDADGFRFSVKPLGSF